MFEIIEKLHIDWKDRRLFLDLYMRQDAVVRITDGELNPGIIGRRVRQGRPITEDRNSWRELGQRPV